MICIADSSKDVNANFWIKKFEKCKLLNIPKLQLY